MLAHVRQRLRNGTVVALFAALFIAIPQPASADESIPELQWPAVTYSGTVEFITSPTGSVTLPCTATYGGTNLMTYDSSGQLVQNISRTSTIDGVTNCISRPAVDKNGNVYGIPYGKKSNGSWAYGTNLLAYSGNTLKWKYPISSACGNVQPAVGVNGIVYTKTYLSGVMHLIGLEPELAPGQTQPTKVFDVVIPNSCSLAPTAYADGIMLYGEQEIDGSARFYSYDGTLLNQALTGDQHRQEVNGEGQLFTPQYGTWQYPAMTYTSMGVTKYNPFQGEVEWSTQVSTSGASVKSVDLYPFTGGGVLAAIKEQKMVAPGVPASPTQWVSKLITLSSTGQVVHSTLLNQEWQGNKFNADRIVFAMDGNGKLAVLRQLNMATQVSYPATVPAITIGVYDALNGTWEYQEIMTGDMDGTEPSGFNLPVSDYPALANDTLFFSAQCSQNCTESGKKLYALKVSGLGMDHPRGDILNAAPRPATPYIALGDSFSSGEGVEPFEVGTDVLDVNQCHRSDYAYPQLVAGSSGVPSLTSDSFRACSGAVTNNVTNAPQWNEGVQLGWWPDSTTEVVTITIGGNDIGFADFASACVFSTCDVGSTAYNDTLDKINNELPDRLEEAYKRILEYAPNAEIYVAGYPQVIANKSESSPADSRCIYMQDGNTNWGDARAARDIVTELNDVIEGKVNDVRALDAGNTRLHFVEMDGAGSPFNGHEVCGTASSSWFQNVDQGTNDPAYVFHPNKLGQEGYATVIGAAID